MKSPRRIALPTHTVALLDLEKRGQSNGVMCILNRFIDNIPEQGSECMLLVSKRMFNQIEKNCPNMIQRHRVVMFPPC